MPQQLLDSPFARRVPVLSPRRSFPPPYSFESAYVQASWIALRCRNAMKLYEVGLLVVVLKSKLKWSRMEVWVDAIVVCALTGVFSLA